MAETPVGIATEMDILRDVVTALAAVSPAAQVRILKHAREWLELPKDPSEPQVVVPAREVPVRTESENAGSATSIPNIRTLRETKKPSTNVEMAALVAYYLSEMAPEAERSDTLDSSMITKYFKQAGHPIPDKPIYTLRDAKNAGYFDTAERGQYWGCSGLTDRLLRPPRRSLLVGPFLPRTPPANSSRAWSAGVGDCRTPR